MVKVLSVFGTRPEAIKMAPVVKELQKHPDRIVNRICVTAQHRQMLDQVLSLFGIVLDYDLNVMQDSQSPTQVAAVILAKLEPILQTERPDWVLVQGDTTTMAAGVTGFRLAILLNPSTAPFDGLRTGSGQVSRIDMKRKNLSENSCNSWQYNQRKFVPFMAKKKGFFVSTYLVTGVAGFIASKVAEFLLADGQPACLATFRQGGAEPTFPPLE